MGYQYQFLSVIPLLSVGCIRVTHPCAGLIKIKQASFLIPLDLHVLGLPLAFILSQDQTLHYKKYCFVKSWLILKGIALKTLLKKSDKTIQLLNNLKEPRSIYSYKELSFLSRNSRLTVTLVEWFRSNCGCKGKEDFRNLQIFEQLFFKVFFFEDLSEQLPSHFRNSSIVRRKPRQPLSKNLRKLRQAFAFSSFAGAKIRTFSGYFQMF